ncbi:DUF5977 domain-containing protein [Spirosoma sp. RP8]|uniref:DUF5977 domain-containing protein n=1 Tax=Spirosoma liriopis TaxID=2937440 RepID=A0ABT0HL36_9BACT|nr:DUF5977 domain-containing protein [Spirosoma liriopis]MCK8492881.1 DUF5977 domain-containing protein [Spirosoma liriopis]
MDALTPLTFLPLRLSRNPMAYTIDAVADSQNRSGLGYFLTLKMPKTYGSGDYAELLTLPGREFPPRKELGATIYPGATFDVGIFIDDFLSRTAPTPDQVGIVTCGDMITPYLTQTRVEQDGALVAGTDKTLPLEYAIKGALSVEQFAGWRDQFFTTYLAQSRQFLTWQPNEKWVDTVQPEFLYYLVNFTPKPAELRLRVDIAYSDGSIDTLTAQRMTTVNQYMVYCMPVGFVALGLPEREAATGKKVHSYQVWIANESAQRLSEVRTYYVNRDYEANILYLLFANSLGGYDTLRCTGQSARTLTVVGTDSQRALDPQYLPTTAEIFRNNRIGERTLAVATGLRDGDELNYLSEVVLSEEVYLVAQEGFVALSLPDSTDTALALRSDDEDLAGRILMFRFAKNEVAYSNLPSPPTAPARATKWVPVNTFCLINDNGLRTGYLGAAKLELRYVDDGSLVKPLRSKSNTPGTDGYVSPIASALCATTPYVNDLVQKAGSYKRNNCGADMEATVATLTIPAGMYGAETAAQLQSRIDSALKAMDTQAYANQYGSCLANPAGYTFNVPDGNWHYRGNLASRLGIETGGAPYMGNAWTMQGQGGNYVYPTGSNDLNFPSTDFTPDAWRLFTYGTAGASARLRVYNNGVLYLEKTFVYNPDGYEYHSLFGKTAGSSLIVASMDKLYVQLVDL